MDDEDVELTCFLNKMLSAEDLDTGGEGGILLTGRFNVGISPGFNVLQVS